MKETQQERPPAVAFDIYLLGNQPETGDDMANTSIVVDNSTIK